MGIERYKSPRSKAFGSGTQALDVGKPPIARNKTSEVVWQFSWGEAQLSLSAETRRLAARIQSVRWQMLEHAVFGSASAL